MSFKMYHVLLSRAPASERYFSFFLDEIAMQNFFHNIPSALLLLCSVVPDSDNFFCFFILTRGKAFVA